MKPQLTFCHRILMSLVLPAALLGSGACSSSTKNTAFHRDPSSLPAGGDVGDKPDVPNAVMTCHKDGKLAFALTKKSRTIYTLTELNHDSRSDNPASVNLRLAGKVNLGMKGGPLVDADPVAAFVATNSPGSHFEMASVPKNGKYAASFSVGYGSSDLECSPGSRFSSLNATISGAKVVDQFNVKEYWDSQLALECKEKNAPATAPVVYQVRAMKEGFGQVSVDLVPVNNDPFPRSMEFESFTFGKKNNYVFKSEDDSNPPSPSEPTVRLYVHKQTSRKLNGDRLHEVTYVPDLKKPDQPMVDLECREMQAYPNVLSMASDQAEMPTAFPSKPGTLADINQALCGDQEKAYSDSRRINDKWSRLIRKVALPDDARIVESYVDRDRASKCSFIALEISNQQGVDALKAIIGVSLEGLEVRYSVPGAK